jgi:hypothetical protein
MTTSQAAKELGVHPSRVRRMATARGIGMKLTDRLWVFSAAEVEAMRVRKPGRPRTRPVSPPDRPAEGP